MKVYEYARLRNINSRDVVRKCHQLGIDTVKNHLSLIPLKRLDELDRIPFPDRDKPIIQEKPTVAVLTLELYPYSNHAMGRKVDQTIRKTARKSAQVYVILPYYNIGELSPIFLHEDVIQLAGKTIFYRVLYLVTDNITYYFLDCPQFLNRDVIDNWAYLTFFYKASIHLLRNQSLDRVIACDWPFGFYPSYYKEQINNQNMPRFQLDLYDVINVGIYDPAFLDTLVLKQEVRDKGIHEGNVHLIKAGLLTYDAFTFHHQSRHKLRESNLADYLYDNY